MAKIRAKDKQCISCGKKALVFFPVVDPDIYAYPYCKQCVGIEKIKLIEKLLKNGLKRNN